MIMHLIVIERPAELFVLIINKPNMFRLAFLASLITLIASINNYNINVPFDGTEDPLLGDFNAHYSPSYSLGTLSKGYSLSIKATLRNKNTQDISGLTISLYEQSSATSTTYTKQTLTTVKSNSTFLQYSYDITLSGSRTQAKFELKAVSNTFIDLNFFTLDVVYYNTSQGANSKKAKTILRVSQTQRHSILRLIYVATPTLLSFSFYPVTTALNNFAVSIKPIQQADWSRSNGWRVVNQPLSTTSTYNDLLKVQSMKTLETIKRGYYLLEAKFSSAKPKDFAKITFQTDIYKCPYDSLHADYYHSFQGCTLKALPSKPLDTQQCIAYNDITGECAECIAGFILAKGLCLADTSCPDRKYFHFGQCLDVSATCGKYDKFTGQCLTCNDPSKYIISQGNCIPKPSVICNNRQYASNQTCLNISQACGTFSPTTGQCLTCKSNLYQLNSDGTCTSATVQCPQGSFFASNSCISIQTECLRYNQSAQQCLVCVHGFYVQNGTCQRLICPYGQVPSRHGRNCIDVSALCEGYDNETGECLDCPHRYTLRGGQCLQIASQLAGCRDRQRLGFGECANASLNCKTYNLKTGNCDECESERYLDYSGHCVPHATCSEGQISISGQCLALPSNCLTANRHGVCIECSHHFRLMGSQCVYFKSCQQHEYLNSAGECVVVHRSCATWNPSNGQCITCKQQGHQPSSGACCPPGHAFNPQIDTCQLRQAASSCEIRHQTINICLKCSDNKAPDYTTPYGCSNNS